jgi:hypothetical protein
VQLHIVNKCIQMSTNVCINVNKWVQMYTNAYKCIQKCIQMYTEMYTNKIYGLKKCEQRTEFVRQYKRIVHKWRLMYTKEIKWGHGYFVSTEGMCENVRFPLCKGW